MNPLLKNFPRYQCHKQVGALKIKTVIDNPRGVELHFKDEGIIPIQMVHPWGEKHKPIAGGYLVAYDDGYLSYSPADAFESGYTPINDQFDEDLLEPIFWKFDAERKESGDERLVFKSFMRAYAVRYAAYAGGVTKHSMGAAVSTPEDRPQFAWSSQAAIDVVAERRRQVDVEGWEPSHDDQYIRNELIDAAVSYMNQYLFGLIPPKSWPFGSIHWKPKDKRSNLVRAAALMM